MYKKVLLFIFICLCSILAQAQSTSIKSMVTTKGEWVSRFIYQSPWADLSLWNQYSENQNTLDFAVKLPLFYYGPFLKKGLLSEIYNPLNNSANSSWFNEKARFFADNSFQPETSRVFFLGDSSGSYVIKKKDRPLVNGIIIHFPVDSSINLDLHFSQTQTPRPVNTDWYFAQRPIYGKNIFHPASGIHYKNPYFKLNIFLIAALSSLTEDNYCGSFQMEVRQKSFLISLYAGAKNAGFINPYGETNAKALESHGHFQWQIAKGLELTQKIHYNLDWPIKPQARFFPGNTGSESRLHWLVYDHNNDLLDFDSHFAWTHSFDEALFPQNTFKTSLSCQWKSNGLFLKLAGSLNLHKALSWQIENCLGAENNFFKGQLSQTWTISQESTLEYNASLSWKQQKSRLFLKLESAKPIEWDATEEKRPGFFEQHKISLGWETQMDNKAAAE
ncbi:MAG: hypothetical protein JXR70_04185 [Spirochaetales bacterium]|nr:hypothetical protein [Spirochaetales bacterium]